MQIKRWTFRSGSIRFQFFSFLAMLLLILLLLLNVYPLISARDAVFQEKEKAMESQAATLASALASLDNPDQESIAEVLRFLDSFLEDVDYLAALEHSDGITRRQYQKDAAKIAEVQRG